MLKKIITSVLALNMILMGIVPTVAEEKEKVKVYLAGDSTVKTYGERHEGGWGEYLQEYFNDDVEIVNKSEGGRASRTFINQGRLDEILNEIKEGDYLFIQFGHNDATEDDKKKIERYVPIGEADENGIYPVIEGKMVETPQELLDLDTSKPYGKMYYPDNSGTYKWYLKQFIDGARQKGAIPVLCTPVSRAYFDENGKIEPHHGENDCYVEAVRQLAKEEDVTLLDLFDKTKSLYEKLGQVETMKLHFVKDNGDFDKTHYSKHGGFVVAGLVKDAIKDSNLAIKESIKESEIQVGKTEHLRQANLYIVGDSISCIYDEDENYQIPRAGWGMKLQQYLDPALTVVDLALSGRSSKSFTTEENYEKLFSQIKEGDYLLIKFGHNDEKDEDPERYTSPEGDKDTEGSFKNSLYKNYIEKAQEIGAKVILLTPASRRKFDDNGIVKDTHTTYDDAIISLGEELDIPVIDLTSITEKYYNEVGKDAAAVLHAAYYNREKGSQGIDDTHFNHFGGDWLCRIVIEEILNSNISTIKNYIVEQSLTADENTYVKRDEFATGIAKMMSILPEEEYRQVFADVTQENIYAGYISALNKEAVVLGDEFKNFRPKDYITQKEAIILALKALQENPENIVKNNLPQYLTEDNISKLIDNYNESERVTKETAAKILLNIYLLSAE